MLLLQGGVAKSGNLWLYRVLDCVFRQAGWERRRFIQNHPIYAQAQTWELSHRDQADVDWLEIKPDGCWCRISSMFREPIADMDAYLRQCSHVWTHSPICARSFEVLPKFDRIVYIIRDPRDAAISMSHFVFTPHVQRRYPPHHEKSPEKFLTHALDGSLRDWVFHVGGYLRQRTAQRIQVVFYERLLHAFDSELGELLEYLGVRLDRTAFEAVRKEADFRNMKTENPNHVRRGQSGGWREVFSAAQKQQAESIASRMLLLLNYPVGDAPGDALPHLPIDASPALVEEAMTQARRNLGGEMKRVYDFLVSDRPPRAKVKRVRDWTRGMISR